jgi:CubicO group peptidase (beta-lactamase class C family)
MLTRAFWLCTILVVGVVCTTGAGASARAARAEIRDIDSYFASQARDRRFSGVVLVARGDEIVLERGYGFADFELAVPMRRDAVMRLGSLTKPVTASAVLVAVQNGRLSLDDRLCDALPNCPRSWSNVRIRHLLSHTSGITDHFGDLEAVPVEQTVAELQRAMAGLDRNEALASPPGEHYAYSNFNYVLLGAMLEHAYGERWETVMRQLVLTPAGAEGIAYDNVWALVPGRALGYTRADDGTLRNAELDDHAAYAAGGLRSTARDLFVWSRALFSGQLVHEPLLSEAFTPVQGQYGYGWQMRQFFGREVQNHNGGLDGFASHFVHYRTDDLTIIILSNVESDAPILAACDAAALYFGVHNLREAPWRLLTPRQRCGIEHPPE